MNQLAKHSHHMNVDEIDYCEKVAHVPDALDIWSLNGIHVWALARTLDSIKSSRKPISTIETEQSMNKFRHEDHQNVGSENDFSFFVSTVIDESRNKYHEQF